MPSNLDCPYCTSCNNKLVSSFHSTVLGAKITVFQCEQCLDLFDIPDRLLKTNNCNFSSPIVYRYDRSRYLVPIDSFWTDPNNFRFPSSEARTLINVTDVIPHNSSPASYLLRLFFGLLQILFGIWLLSLAFGF